jgi:signal transduction histidine kinase
MLFIFAGVLLLGLFAIYRSARTAVDLSERRARFVSSVTHELKTPLTNIRMYIEMLEQDIAPDPEREQAYFRILGSESARLSRLIDNVLELSRLEKKQRPLNIHPGTFDEVVAEVEAVMGPKLRQEGFVFKVRGEAGAPFRYDREAMIQVLINLIENSLKFGRHAPVKEIELRLAPTDGGVCISIADTGPGIPRASLRRVFDDFYRVEGPLTRSTSGTGIGLALVKRYVTAMGGTVSAANNTGAGCTISLSLPA